MAKVIVTGGSGKLGRAVVRHLLDHGWDVVVLDAQAPKEPLCPFTVVDLSDMGDTLESILAADDRHSGVDAIVHLAAIPAPGMRANARTFHANTAASYNVFQSARHAGIRNVVFASSETVLGLPFDEPPPYMPVDEDYEPRPNSSYSLGKVVDETVARDFCRRDPKLKMVGLRFSNVMELQDYAAFPGFDADAQARKWNLWGYIDARDGAQAVRKALEWTGAGFEAFIVANADTVMSRPNAELAAEVFPGVGFKREVGANETLLSIDKARRVLGFEPEFSWRNEPAAARGAK